MDVLKELHKVNAQRSIEAFNTAVTDWSLPEWGNAVAGEVGEMCNLIKKIHRGDFEQREAHSKVELGKEMADIIIYLDLMAIRENIDLEKAIIDKFNEVSDRRQCKIKI